MIHLYICSAIKMKKDQDLSWIKTFGHYRMSVSLRVLIQFHSMNRSWKGKKYIVAELFKSVWMYLRAVYQTPHLAHILRVESKTRRIRRVISASNSHIKITLIYQVRMTL